MAEKPKGFSTFLRLLGGLVGERPKVFNVFLGFFWGMIWCSLVFCCVFLCLKCF